MRAGARATEAIALALVSAPDPSGARAAVRVPGPKVTVPLSAEALPRDLVPMDGPASEPTLILVLEGGSLLRPPFSAPY